ncbi:MAG: sugar phosphate isomerase/epimerase [Maribacter sp.]|nr:sugar phosphate isomerase/epimerase [Maribacter sp.]
MGKDKISRRKAIGTGLLGSFAALGGLAFDTTPIYSAGQKTPAGAKLPFRISLNTSTISAYNLGVDQQIDKVAAAGFDGIELWMRDIMSFLENGGTTTSLKEKLEAGNLVLENIIGFAPWCSDDEEVRKKALEQMHNEMRITRELGGRFIAAPVMGIKTLDCSKFDAYTQRYRDILELQIETSVTPLLEIWGTGALSKLSDCAKIVLETGHPEAAMLLDFYHLYRGGSGYDTLDCLNGKRLPVIHMNDFPAAPVRESLTDADRILPGDGICPFDRILPKLYGAGFRGGLSVELFNKEYWATLDADAMLAQSYMKTAQVIERAFINKT